MGRTRWHMTDRGRGRAARTGRAARAAQPEQGPQAGQAAQPAQPGQGPQAGQAARTTRATRAGQATQPAQPDQAARPEQATASKRTREPGPLARVVEHWWNRLIGAVFGGRLSSETEQYLAHQTKRDYVCNTVGNAVWGGMFPVLTMVCTWLVGAEQAGVFSMAFTVGTLLLFLANYGMRTYQVSDLSERRTFMDYQVSRFVTCAVMMAVGWGWCHLRGYDDTMFAVCMGVLAFRAVDGLADVYEGRLQQKDKLYLSGVSQAVRCAMGFVAFCVVLLLTRNLPAASIAMAAGGVASLLLLTVPLALFETDHGGRATLHGVRDLLVECFPLFLALFLYNLIDSMPKFVMEGALSYDNQLYYTALYFPAHSILMAASFVYRPQLVRLARIWDDPEKHRRFDLLVVAMMGAIALITGAMALFMGWLGIPLMSLMYGLDFEPLRPLAYVMVATGGICACIDFLYQMVTVLRAQRQVSKLYLVALAFSVPVLVLLVRFSGLAGAVVGALVSMAILLVLLVMEYASIRSGLGRARAGRAHDGTGERGETA